MKARGYRRSYFQKLLVYFILMSLIPMLATGLAVYFFSLNTAENMLQSQAEANMAEMQNGFLKMADEYGAATKALSQDKNIIRYLEYGEEYYYDANYAAFLTMGGKTGQVGVHVVSATQNTGISTATIPIRYQYPYNRNWGIFRMMKAAQSTVLAAAEKDMANAQAAFSVGSPVFDDSGGIVGYVIADLYRECVEQWISAKLLSEYGYRVFLTDQNGYVAYSSQGAAHEGLNKLPAYVGAPLTGGSETVWLDGQKHSINTVRLEGLPIYIIYDVPIYMAARNIQPIRTIMLSIGVASLLVCTLASLAVAKGVSRPIHQLSSAMADVEQGNFDVRLRFDRDDEIGALDSSFNSMAQQIKTLIMRVEDEQRSLRIAESKALQAQIKPHFLYNTLDLIKWSAKLRNMENINTITVCLGKLLRALMSTGEDTYTVRQELELADNYIAIQKLRHADKISVVLDIDDSALELRIPKLILQPLIENAIVHGLENKKDAGTLLISCKRQREYLVFTVSDNGSGIPQERLDGLLKAIHGQSSTPSLGIGLQNVAMRTALYSDPHCGLWIESPAGEGTTVRVVLLPQ